MKKKNTSRERENAAAAAAVRDKWINGKRLCSESFELQLPVISFLHINKRERGGGIETVCAGEKKKKKKKKKKCLLRVDSEKKV